MSTNSYTNIDPHELEKFNRLAHNWWDIEGPFRPLHKMNPVRISYINNFTTFAGKTILDVGCGGGIATESMSRLGGLVVGIDQAEKPLQIAKDHSQKQQLTIDYLLQSVEAHAQQQPQSYDIITCLEMLEHVPNPQAVVAACSKLLKPGGWLFFSTINRTTKAFVFAIIGAEYILRILPKGTHTYAAFIRPSELINWAENNQLQVKDTTGLLYNPLSETFTTGLDVSVNYFVASQKES